MAAEMMGEGTVVGECGEMALGGALSLRKASKKRTGWARMLVRRSADVHVFVRTCAS